MSLILDGLEAESYDRSYSDRQLLARIARYFQPHAALIAGIMLLLLVSALLESALPILMAYGLDRATTALSPTTVALVGAAIVCAGVVSWLGTVLRARVVARLVGDIVLALRRDVVGAITGYDMAFYDRHPSGTIVSRVLADTESLAIVVNLTLHVLSQLLQVVLLLAVLCAINPGLAIWLLPTAPLIIGIALVFRRIARRLMTRSQRALAGINASVQETMSGIAVARNFHQEPVLYEQFRAMSAQLYRINLWNGISHNTILPLLTTVGGLGITLVIYFGGRLVLQDAVSLGSWLLAVTVVELLWSPLTDVAAFWSLFQEGLAASERVFALMDADARIVQRDRQSVLRLAGEIAFQNVDFHYNAQEPVFERLNLTIEAGTTVALVGHTGAGKSSLARLIGRFYEFQGGQILIDGHDIRDFDLQQYRRQLAIVPQRPFLIADSVANNIRYGTPTTSDAEVARAAAQIGGGMWLAALPDGLETVVGEQSQNLSIGQRQLVALARVLLQHPAIVILDEATASVDPLTEAQIQAGLALATRECTTIIIAHRLSTVRHADRILVLDRGRIIEDGDHRALLAQGGLYAQLYTTYFRHQAPDYQPGA